MSGSWKKGKPRTTSLLDGNEDEFRRVNNTMQDKDLAAHFNVAVISIERWRKKLGLTKTKLSDGSPHFKENKDDFIKLHDEYSDEDLATLFEISVSGVEKWRGRLGLKKDPSKKWEINEHPKGHKGKKHSPEAREKMGKKSKLYWANLTEEEKNSVVLKGCRTRLRNGTLHPKNRHKTTWKSGWRTIKDKKYYFRSRWEFNYALYLEFLKEQGAIIDWEFEPDTFWFEKIKRGVRSYLPDFKIHGKSGIIYHEVKGWMDSRSKTKLKRMAKYYPDVKLVVIAAKQYNEIKKNMSGILKDWEF